MPWGVGCRKNIIWGIILSREITISVSSSDSYKYYAIYDGLTLPSDVTILVTW